MNPRISMFHDVLTTSEMAAVRRLARPRVHDQRRCLSLCPTRHFRDALSTQLTDIQTHTTNTRKLALDKKKTRKKLTVETELDIERVQACNR